MLILHNGAGDVLGRYDIHTEMGREDLGTVTAVADGIYFCFFDWGANVQEERGSWESSAI